jgi:hypothetical protein
MIPDYSFDARLAQLGKASQRAAFLSLAGFLIILASMSYAAIKLRQLEQEKQQLSDSVKYLRSHTDELLRTQEGVLDFLGGVTTGERIRLIDPSVNWAQTKKYLIDMPAGPQKNAVLTAILLAWKDLPFSLDNHSLASGLDSPHFINVVLSSVGVTVQKGSNERLSDAMMRQFKKVDSPMPGDLIFYKGNVGSFAMMYIAPGSADGKGIAVGTLQTGEEVQVVDTVHINTPVYPFIGYFRVPYPESAPGK